MVILNIDGALFKKMIVSGSNALSMNKDAIDALNVFPVPDGDTGTNMSLTLLAAVKEAESAPNSSISGVAKAIASGSLRGARGNSGVILSQLFRGFAKGLENHAAAYARDIANAFRQASETAYRAVMKPKEGTILTVAREMAERACEVCTESEDIVFMLSEVLKRGIEILAKTKEMLPALQQAGVVDAGGYGLICLWQAAFNCMVGIDGATVSTHTASKDTKKDRYGDKFPDVPAIKEVSENIKFGYCTEFFIFPDDNSKITTDTEAEYKQFLDGIGDSIVAIFEDGFLKVHVHTNNPGKVIERALEIGYLDKIKIDNMRLQNVSAASGNTSAFNTRVYDESYAAVENAYSIIEKDLLEKGIKSEGFNPENAILNNIGNNIENNMENNDKDLRKNIHKKIGVIVTSSGDGFRGLFESFGADIVIEGGQTMNPSAEDFISAIEQLNSDNIIILPNNKNVILAAQQASFLAKGKNIFVLQSKSIPQGVAALFNYSGFDSDTSSVEDYLEMMEEAIKNVKTGQITHAVRSTVIDGKNILTGDIICMIDGNIKIVEKNLMDGARALIDEMLSEGGEVLSIFYGKEATEDEAAELLEYVSEKHPLIDAETHNGGQSIYNFIFSIE